MSVRIPMAGRRARPVRPLVAMLVLALACVLPLAASAQDAGPPVAAVSGVPLEVSNDFPLAPAHRSSPRETFLSFRQLAQGAADSLVRAIERSAENDAIFDTPELRDLKAQAIQYMNRAASTLDLSAVPPASRTAVGISSVLMLEEIMDRVPLPAADAIPDEAAVDAGAAPNGWTLPGTEIRMTRIEGPDGEPRFLFSGDTVSRLPEFYARVRDLPRHSADRIDFYQSFVAGPGLSMPIEFYRYVLELPDWMLGVYAEQSVWQWLAFGLLTLVFGTAVFFLLRWELSRAQPLGSVSRALKRLFVPFVLLAGLGVFRWIADDLINLTGGALATMQLAVVVLQAVTLAAIAVLAANVVAALVISMPRVRKESLDASLIRLVMRVLGIIVAGYVLSLGATRVGIPLYGIIASLGVGGLALALAVRPTLENFVGGIILYADRPVKVGDFCKFGDMLGTVEAIGLRSTKIRALDRTLVTVQNSEFAQMSLTNFTRRDANLMHSTISLRHDTPAGQLDAVIDGTAAMLAADERVDEETVRVCLRGIGEYALEIEIWCYVKCPDWGQFLKIQEDLFRKVIDIVREAGASLALPARTTYLHAAPSPDDSRNPLARSEVRSEIEGQLSRGQSQARAG